MVEIVRSFGLAWVPVRKVGTTSIRLAFRTLADGPNDLVTTADRPMAPDIRWRARNCRKFTVVRDPVDRFVSAYRNRIHHHGDMEATVTHRALTRALGLSPRPEIDEFVDRYWRYYWANDILRRHFRPQIAYIGRNLSWYDAIYRLENLADLASDLSERTGRAVRIDRLQTGGPSLGVGDLPARTRARLDEIVAADRAALAPVLMRV